MNHGVSPSPGGGVFLVQCADCKCLAVRGANGRWQSLYEGIELSDDTKPVMAIPVELILPFLPALKRARLCPVRLPVQN